MITVKFEAYFLTQVCTGVIKETFEPIITEKPQLVYKSEHYFDNSADPEDIFSVFKDACIHQKYNNDERLMFVDFKECKDGFVYETASDSFKYKTTVSGWTNWEEKVKKVYTIKQIIHKEDSTTNVLYHFTDKEKHVYKTIELCPDYHWEFDETVVGFPITYCTQGGVVVTVDYHGIR